MESEVKWTEGPWTFVPGDRNVYGADGFGVADASGCAIARHADPTKHPSEPGQSIDRSWDEEQANARLMAAAPCMAEALERISNLTPEAANATDARALHLTIKAIADAALSRARGAQ